MGAVKKKGKGKRKKGASIPIAPPAPPWKRNVLIALAAFYLLVVWLDGVGSNLPVKLLPRSMVYFAQIAALFRYAGEKQIDYRAEGWVCSEHKWVEVDVRPYFPLDADNKENRFYRAVQFYRRDRKVLRALEEYVIGRYNRTADKKIGGVRFLSLRIPYPPVGATIEPFHRKELSSYPEDQRHNWYWTPGSKRRERCGEKPLPKEDDDEQPTSKPSVEDEKQ